MYSYGYPDPHLEEFTEAMTALGPLLGFFIILMFVIMIAGLVGYILRGVATVNMSKARGLQNGWLGFIPIVRDYQLGEIAGDIEIGDKKITNTGIWLVVVPIIFEIVTIIGLIIVMVPYMVSLAALGVDPAPEAVLGPVTYFTISMTIFMLIIIVAQVFLYLVTYLAYHKIFTRYATGQKPVFYLIIAMFVPLGFPVLLYMLSKRPMLPTEYPAQPTPGYPPVPPVSPAPPVPVPGNPT